MDRAIRPWIAVRGVVLLVLDAGIAAWMVHRPRVLLFGAVGRHHARDEPGAGTVAVTVLGSERRPTPHALAAGCPLGCIRDAGSAPRGTPASVGCQRGHAAWRGRHVAGISPARSARRGAPASQRWPETRDGRVRRCRGESRHAGKPARPVVERALGLGTRLSTGSPLWISGSVPPGEGPGSAPSQRAWPRRGQRRSGSGCRPGPRTGRPVPVRAEGPTR